MNEFYTNLRILSQDLYKRTSSTEQHRSAAAGKLAAVSRSNSGLTGTPSSSTSEYFGAQSMQARMQRYVQEGGGGIPSDFMDRYNRDTKAAVAEEASRNHKAVAEEAAGVNKE